MNLKSCYYQYWLVVKTHILETLRPRRVGTGTAHHTYNQSRNISLESVTFVIITDISPYCLIIVWRVGDSASLHQIAVTFLGTMLTFELVTSINFSGLKRNDFSK